MNIPVEILVLWERYYRRGDYKAICELLRNKGILCSPKQLVNQIHRLKMQPDVYVVFEGYYIEREK